MFIRWEIIYDQPLDKKKPYIFMPNHTTLWDVFAAGAFFPVYVSALEAHTHFKWPVYGWAIKAYGQIPINRKNPKASWNAYLKAIEKLKQGISIIVFPEGTRSPDGKLQRFKKIPFKFVKEAGVDLVPVGFVNLYKLSPANVKWIKPVKIKIHFGKPIPKEAIEKMDIEQLMELTYEQIKKLSEQ
jgi:1-acyl-sn-glycerol-3-phosphate acyltransferase